MNMCELLCAWRYKTAQYTQPHTHTHEDIVMYSNANICPPLAERRSTPAVVGVGVSSVHRHTHIYLQHPKVSFIKMLCCLVAAAAAAACMHRPICVCVYVHCTLPLVCSVDVAAAVAATWRRRRRLITQLVLDRTRVFIHEHTN